MTSVDNPLMGPAPFRFRPRDGSLEGPAFSRAFQLLTSAIVFGSLGWWVQLWLDGKFGATGWEGLRAAGWFVLGWCLLAWTAWQVWTSRVRLDEHGLHQTWIWNKDMAYDDLAYAKLLRVRGLEWVMAPRLYVRTLVGKFAVFYISDADVLQEAERLSKELQAFRAL